MVPSIKVIQILKQKIINYLFSKLFSYGFYLGLALLVPSPCAGESNLFPYCFPNPHSSSTYFRAESGRRRRRRPVDIQPASKSTTGNVWPPLWSTQMHIIFCLSFCSVQARLLISLTCTAHLHHAPNEGPFVIDYSALHLHGFMDGCILHLLWIVMPKLFCSGN